MNIGFDAKRAFFNRTGLGNYSRNLIQALHQFYPDNNYQLFTPKPKANHLFETINQWQAINLITPEGLWPDALWRSFGMNSALKKNATHIYHGLSAELPLGGKQKNVKYVVTIHDLIFMRFPDLYNALDRKIYFKKTKAACEKADRIIAISEQTKKDIVSFLSVAADKIDVVYQNCDASFLNETDALSKQLIRQQYKLPERFLLSVGTLEKRKNAALILKALVHLPEDVNLVLVGKPTDYQTELDAILQANNLRSRVTFLNKIPFEHLPALYQMAEIFIYPSIFEGFGIPIIEALYSKIPVIAATGSCLEEAGGPHSLYCSPHDPEALAAAVQSLWNKPEKRQIQIAAGHAYASRFSAAQFAHDTMEVYEKL